MSISMIVLKEIEGYSYDTMLNSVQRAAHKAGIHCVGLETLKHVDCMTGKEEEYLSGTLSEVPAEILKLNFENDIHTRQCGFTIQRPTSSSYDSFTWLLKKENYFDALDLEYLGGDFEFAVQFLSQYFQLVENAHDYLWIDDTDWFYSAKDLMWLSNHPYNPEWAYKKLIAT